MCLIRAPLLNPAFVDRTTNLLGAGRAHGPVSLVKIHTGLIKRQTTIIENPPNLAFQVFQDIRVLNAQDSPFRENTVPMRHQIDIAAIVVSNIIEAVGELLTFREELLEARPTTIHRVAPRIDDLGIGQDQMHQADCQ